MRKQKNEIALDFHFSDTVEMNAPGGGIKGFFAAHRATLQFVLFMVFSILAFVAQIVVQKVGELALASVDKTVYIWPFEPQALGMFISYLAANVVAKVISFVMNRKKTFGANNNPIFSAVAYTIMVVVLIIVETIIGTPLAEALKSAFISMGVSPTSAFLPWCSTISMILYSAADFIIVFFMDKFVIMRNIDHSDENVITNENGIVVDYNHLA